MRYWGAAFDVFDFVVTDEISSIYELESKIVAKRWIAPKELLTKEALFTMKSSSGDSYFHGFITKVTEEEMSGNRYVYEITVVPKFWRLGKKTDLRIFQEMTTKDILKKVLEENEVTSLDYDLRLKGEYSKREYCVQYRESCKDFLERLMAEEGIFYFFEINNKKHVMVIADQYTEYKDIPHEASVEFNQAGISNLHKEYIKKFEYSESLKSGKAVLTDYHFKTPLKLATANKLAKQSPEKLELYDYPGLVLDESTGKRLAQATIEAERSECRAGVGESNCKRLSAGRMFSLVKHEQDSKNGKYIITSVTHSGEQPQVLQELADTSRGATYGNDFNCVIEQTNFRPIKLPKPSVQGIQTAVVTGPSGEEIYTDEYGRIKVQFHWDREGQKDEKSSCWMRVAQPWAGSGWGSVFIPRIGQEVIISFVDGDPDRPMVTGAVYNGNNRPPYDLPAEKTKSTLKTHSTKGGGDNNYNELRFEDKKGEEEIYLQGEKDWNILIKNDKGQHVGNDETLNVDHDRSKTVGNDQSEEIGKNKTISVGENHTETINKDKTLMVKGNTTITTKKDHTEEINGNLSLTVDKDTAATVKKNLGVTVEKDYTTNVTGSVTFTSDKEIILKTGKASLVMKKNGEIILKGGAITVKGSKDVVIKGKNITGN